MKLKSNQIEQSEKYSLCKPIKMCFENFVKSIPERSLQIKQKQEKKKLTSVQKAIVKAV